MSYGHQAAVDEVTHTEQILYRAMIAHDFEALGRLLADDVVYVHSTGLAESKQEYFTGITAGLYEYSQIRSSDVRTTIDGNVAIQFGVNEMTVCQRGKPWVDLKLFCTLIWKRDGASWRLILRQATRVP